MLWLALWLVVTVIGVVAVVASANSLRFSRRVSREVRELWAGTAEPRRIERQRIEALPAPVRRYLSKAVGERELAVRTVRLRHGGTFRTRLDGGWLPIRGEQYFAADPPGFVWWGRVRLAPGLWIDARDRSLANSVGPELDRGALHRMLGEMTWFPTAFLDDRYVAWSAIDDRRTQATLRVKGQGD